jgi:hypothetical protein
MTKIVELLGISTTRKTPTDWARVVRQQQCPFLDRKCIKVRKSQPKISIGTCTVSYGSSGFAVMICPYRLLERRQILTDCIHLLSLHEPGNELHIVPEINLPGGSVDYFLVSVRDDRVKDFVGVELQTLDTTGTVWPERQRFLKESGLTVSKGDVSSDKSFGMNWKMTAKTTLIQLHHKIATFEHINKHLVLVTQDHLMSYLRRQFNFAHLHEARLGDSMHFHSYSLSQKTDGSHRIDLVERLSTDSDGIALCLGLLADPNVELDSILKQIQAKISSATLFTIG